MGTAETIAISIISALAASYFTYLFGFKQYLKQKTREEIREDYIKNGIDKVIKALNRSSFLCDFNFAKAIRIIEYLEKSLMDRKLGEEIIKKVFSEMQTMTIAPPPEIYKVQLLGGEYQDFFRWIIETIADYSRYIDYLRHELLLEIELYFRYPEKYCGKEQRFFEGLKKSINEFYKAVSLNEPLKSHLLNLRIRVDEIEIFTMRDFDKKILKDKKIKEILKEAKEDYKKLKENEKKQAKE